MKLNHVLRDIIILILFCGGFYLLTQTVNMLGGNTSIMAATSEFSKARRDADYYLERKENELAIPHLVKLTEQDPNNSHAWFHLARCNFSLFKQRRKLTINNTFEPESNEEKGKAYANQAIKAYKKVLDYPRYRRFAKKDLSIIYAQLDERELALKYLREAVEERAFSYRTGPREIEYLRPLFEDPEYLAIEERYFRRDYYRYKSKKPSVDDSTPTKKKPAKPFGSWRW